MPKLSVTEAEKLVAVKKSTIYADTDSGKVSFEINLAGIKSSTCRTRPRLWLRETAPNPVIFKQLNAFLRRTASLPD